jgi:hypothetical protein
MFHLIADEGAVTPDILYQATFLIVDMIYKLYASQHGLRVGVYYLDYQALLFLPLPVACSVYYRKAVKQFRHDCFGSDNVFG